MKVTFLGTGTSQGVPVLCCSCPSCMSSDDRDKRLRSSVYIEVQGVHMVIDTGPDFRTQLLRSGVRSLDAVLYTHQHKDHTAGLDDIRPFNFFCKKAIPLYATEAVLTQLRSEYAYIFTPSDYAGWLPQVALNPITTEPFTVAGVTVQPIQLRHGKLPILGYRIGNFAYLTDASYIANEEKAKLQGLEYLVLNALRHEPHPAHFTLQEACALAKELDAEHTYLTHISHLMGCAAEQVLPTGIELAYDTLTFSLHD